MATKTLFDAVIKRVSTVLKLLSKIRKYRRQKAYLFPGYAFAFMDEGIAIAAICRPNELSAIV